MIDHRSVVNNPIVREGSISLGNPEGDLIIDAPIVSIRGNITLVGKNIYCTTRAKIIIHSPEAHSPLEGNILVQYGTNFQMTPGISCPGAFKIMALNGNDPGHVQGNTLPPKENVGAAIRLFDRRHLKPVAPLGAQSREAKSHRPEAKMEDKSMAEFLEKYELIGRDTRPRQHKVVFWGQPEEKNLSARDSVASLSPRFHR